MNIPFLLLCLCLLIISISFIKYEYFTVNFVTFLLDYETRELLEADPGGYFASLTSQDLFARGVKSKAEYFNQIETLSFTENERDRIQQLCEKINVFLQTQPTAFGILEEYGISVEKFNDLPWVFALTRGETFENGLPHTHGQVIFLSTLTLQQEDSKMIETLLHEKIHVYQRVFRAEFLNQLERLGYIHMGPSKGRSNPDIDRFEYQHPNGYLMRFEYTSDRPTSINDIKKLGMFEHPFEEVAYLVSNKLFTLIYK